VAGRQGAGQHAEQRGLARAVGPHHAQRFTAPHLEIDPMQHLQRAEVLGDAGGTQHDVLVHDRRLSRGDQLSL
jgi:hypothetical protein